MTRHGGVVLCVKYEADYLLGRLSRWALFSKKVEAWPFTFGGEEHSGWLPSDAVMPEPTPRAAELLDVTIEQTDGGYLLIWAACPSATCRDALPPKSGDTWHETINDAEAAACEYFGIQHEHWRDISATA